MTKSESGKTQTRRRAAPGTTNESKSQPRTMRDSVPLSKWRSVTPKMFRPMPATH